MSPLHQIVRSQRFYRGIAIVLLCKLAMLLLFTPMYDLDTNSYIRGGLTWDIYHNPFLNLYIAVLRQIWSHAGFFIAVQCLGFAAGAAFFIEVLWPRKTGTAHFFWWASVAVAALEPVTSFYNLSLISESFFTTFVLVACGMAILWLRNPRREAAWGLGAALGLAFLCKLSALILLPLMGVFLLRGKKNWKHAALAGLPFVFAYLFVYFGQQAINGGDLYTVEGRVRWDFGSALYEPELHSDPEFARFVHPYILRDGQLVPHRELRRELSYLGYKDCVQIYEDRGYSANHGINACDSLFGKVAASILKDQFWKAELQFVRDNFRFIHELNYLDYRFTPGLHHYYPEEEYQYLDSLMGHMYHVDLSERRHRIPGIWTSLSFGNTWMPILWWLWWAALLGAAAILWQDKKAWEALVVAGLTTIPLIFHLVYISYRPRFLAPYLVMVLLLVLWQVNWWAIRLKSRKPLS